MLLSALKPWDEILEYLAKDEKVFLVGCSGCAEASGTGGPAELAAAQTKLEEAGKKVVGRANIDFLCQKALVKSRLRGKKAAVLAADSFLVFACGIGVQAVAATVNKPCHPACNTISLGGTRGMWSGTERCRECGDCVLHYTGGICPLTACTKGLLNGACGGASRGKCEADKTRDCGWELIYHRLAQQGRLDQLKVFLPPKDYSKMLPGPELRTSAFYALEETESI